MNKAQAILSFHAICKLIRLLDTDHGLIAYAKAYAKKGEELNDPEAIVSQIPYIQSNIKSWSGLDAKEAKLKLKEIQQILKSKD